MKKLVLTMLFVLTCEASFALPVGNPSDASLLYDGIIWEGHCLEPCDPCGSWCEAVSIRIGFYGDYVFNRHLELDQGHKDAVIESTQIFTNAGYFALNFYDRLDLFATLGASNLFIDTNANAFDGRSGDRLVIETSTDFSWSLGMRGTLWECGCTALGAEFQYFTTRPDLTRVTIAASESIYNDDMFDAKYREWQFGLGISQRFTLLVPYLAVKWAGSKLFFDNASFTLLNQDIRLYNLKAQKLWGWAVGVSLVDCDMLALTVEARFADEKAVHVNGQLRF